MLRRTAVLGASVLAAAIALPPSTAGCAESATGSGYDGPKEKLHVYLLLGGTNMCGRADFKAPEAGAIPGCLLLNRQDLWEPAENPLSRHSSIMTLLGAEGLSPGYTFALTMRAADPSVTIGLVVNSVIGKKETTIAEWLKGTEYYNEAVRRAKAAAQRGTLQGIVWQQGEGDLKDAQYLDKLKTLVADLRGDLGDPELPFVAGQIGGAAEGGKAFNERLAQLPAQSPRTGFASAEGLTVAYRTWFDSAGMKALGRRHAEAMLKIQGRKVPDENAKPGPGPAPERPAGSGYSGPKEKLHIYLLIGQSNMDGRAEYTKDEAGVIDRCLLLNGDNRWEPGRVPLNRYSSILGDKPLDGQRLNPGYGFVKAMLEAEKDPEVRIGLISNARGSTFISQWRSGYRKEAIKRVKIAQESGVVKGILWHQGESDNKNAGYLEELKGMIADYRKDLGDPNLPFVAGEILNYRGVGKLINDQLAQLPAQVPFTGVASAEGLTGTEHVLISTDNVHFDMKSMKTLGRRYAEAMLAIQQGKK